MLNEILVYLDMVLLNTGVFDLTVSFYAVDTFLKKHMLKMTDLKFVFVFR